MDDFGAKRTLPLTGPNDACYPMLGASASIVGDALRAQCQCGQLGLEGPDRPLITIACHCNACQRRTGAPFGVLAYYRRDQVVLPENESLTSASLTKEMSSEHFLSRLWNDGICTPRQAVGSDRGGFGSDDRFNPSGSKLVCVGAIHTDLCTSMARFQKSI